MVDALKFEDDPEENDEPIGWINMAVICSFFVLREVEGSLMMATSVEVNADRKTVTILLLVGKTDTKALGCERTWGCVCVDGGTRACPYHAAARQKELIWRRFGDEVNRIGFPLFPTPDGTTVDKAVVVIMIEKSMSQLGFPLVNKDGRRALGGHAFRVGGSQWLCKCGVSDRVIAILARWGSEVIFGYLRDAPLQKLTDEYIQGRAALDDIADKVNVSGPSHGPTVDELALKKRKDKGSPLTSAHLKMIEDLAAKWEAQEGAVAEIDAMLKD